MNNVAKLTFIAVAAVLAAAAYFNFARHLPPASGDEPVGGEPRGDAKLLELEAALDDFNNPPVSLAETQSTDDLARLAAAVQKDADAGQAAGLARLATMKIYGIGMPKDENSMKFVRVITTPN